MGEREAEKSKLKKSAGKGGVGMSDPDGYNECYPGLEEMADAIDDSDEEADYSKMDLVSFSTLPCKKWVILSSRTSLFQGNKKGPVGRWDFDTQEEYADYMGKKEAMPKAAFQYGVKMSEGRKTRGKVGVQNEKAKLDREWNKISAIIDKRKGGGKGEGSAAKKAKM